jgi:diguanylate cyclase (GGDEF)-like protein/putative nucleotidyltransferase with HDIG domain
MAIMRDRERHIVETEALHLRTIQALAMAVEAKDENTHRHLMRVRVYVSELGKIMGLDKPLMQALLTAAYLHDIGKLAVPEYIINKPGKLTPEEFEKMKIHPVVGADILERVHFPYPVVPIVRSHHEAWDGSGYPDGLKGEEIPIGARILTAVDCFDALASDRPYRKAMPLDQAMEFVKKRAGTQFDADVVKLLADRYLELEELARQQIQEVEPLKTDLFIQRGAAPGAGFAPEQSPTANGSGTVPAAPTEDSQDEPLSLITAATQEGKALFELSQAKGTSLGPHELCAMMSARLQPVIPFDCLAVYLKQGESVSPRYIGGPSAQAFSSQSIPVGEGLSGWVAQSARPIVNGNPTVEPNCVAEKNLFTATSSALSVPLFDLNGGVFAVLTVYSSKPAAFSTDHLRILQASKPGFSLALENALRLRTGGVEAQLDPHVDPLTQLPDVHRLFELIDAQIEKTRGTGQTLAVVACDLIGFKAVNVRHGQAAGDELLRAIAHALVECCGPEDTIARIGGDEFGFLFPTMDLSSAVLQLQMLEPAVQHACNELRVETGVSLSVGAAFYPADGETAEELLGAADRKIAQHKRSLGDLQRAARPRPFLIGGTKQ